MQTVLYILIAILAFGILIFVHELGHFLCARIFGVHIQEFAIGMGPKLVSHVSKKTGIRYSWRLLPIGGFVNMGEDDMPEDGTPPAPDSFRAQAVWKRFLILASGALMNLLLGILLMGVIVASSPRLASTTVSGFVENASSEASGLQVGDRIVAVNRTRIHIAEELIYEIMYQGNHPVDLTVVRDGERLVLAQVSFPNGTESGVTYGAYDFYVEPEAKNVGNVLRHAFFRSGSTVKMIWQSLTGLITGRYSVQAVSGPIGITEAITEAASSGFNDLLYLFVVISMNLGVFNLLPVPALDGGRLLFLIIEGILGRPVNPKYEAMIHFVGLCILMLLMVLVSIKDIAAFFR